MTDSTLLLPATEATPEWDSVDDDGAAAGMTLGMKVFITLLVIAGIFQVLGFLMFTATSVAQALSFVSGL